MPYPAAPWQMHGQLWLSLFRVRGGEHVDRPAGLYGAALVSYEDPSQLTYSELLVAHPVRGRASITDIWVDSVDSRDGGRELWAIPKDLCDFERHVSGRRLQRTSWAASLEGRPIATARFTDISRATFRTPFKAGTWQRFPDDHPRAAEWVGASFSGSGRALPCRGSWDFDEQGPLAWLAGKRPVLSVRMADFAMSFG